MLRPLIVSVVLAIAFGPSAGLACKSLCNPETAAASGCHYRGDSTEAPILLGNVTCDESVATVALALTESARRGASVSASDSAVAVPRWQVAPPATDQPSDRALGPVTLLEKRPLETSLRI